MPDLGKYSAYVLTAYGLSGIILTVLVLQSWVRYRSMRTNLTRVEEQVSKPQENAPRAAD